jgi:hypothetical protein
MIIVGERVYKGEKLETSFLPLTFNSLSEAMLATTPFEHWVIYQKNIDDTYKFICEDI